MTDQNELIDLVNEYNAKTKDGGYAIISSGSRVMASLNKKMDAIRDKGHTVGYRVGIISVEIDGKEVL